MKVKLAPHNTESILFSLEWLFSAAEAVAPRSNQITKAELTLVISDPKQLLTTTNSLSSQIVRHSLEFPFDVTTFHSE
jgi:hypothetical protein